jgi:hypothetical protein
VKALGAKYKLEITRANKIGIPGIPHQIPYPLISGFELLFFLFRLGIPPLLKVNDIRISVLCLGYQETGTDSTHQVASKENP